MARKGTVTVVGAGYYGSTTAQRLAEYDIFDKVVLTDIKDGWAEGLALDLNQSRPVEGFETQVVGKTTTTDLLHVLIERATGLGVLGLDDLTSLASMAGHPQAGKLRLTAGLPR